MILALQKLLSRFRSGIKRYARPQGSSFAFPELQQAARHWDEWQQARPATCNGYTDWGDHPTVFRAVMRHAFGSEDSDFFVFLRQHYPECTHAHALSLCCGDGAFEQQLISQGVFKNITGIEISEIRIAHGQARLESLHSETGLPCPLTFVHHDVNLGNFGEAQYDVVFAKAALHHIMSLDAAFDGMVRCLKPGGLLVAIDFFGPSRFQWTEQQLVAAERFWNEQVPPALRLDGDGRPFAPVTRPTVESMLALDPSEAACSAKLAEAIGARFDILHDIALGGTLMNLLLYGERVNQFDPDDPLHNEILRAAVAWEHELISQGVLGSDFRFVVARRKC